MVLFSLSKDKLRQRPYCDRMSVFRLIVALAFERGVYSQSASFRLSFSQDLWFLRTPAVLSLHRAVKTNGTTVGKLTENSKILFETGFLALKYSKQHMELARKRLYGCNQPHGHSLFSALFSLRQLMLVDDHSNERTA